MTMEKQESSKAITNILNWGLPLPPHIAPFIFSKLSISNLPLCRSVCKSWNHLVLDYAHSFSKFHLPNSIIISTRDCTPISTLPFTRFLNPKIQCFDIDTLSIVASTVAGPYVESIQIYNYCNGLLFIGKRVLGIDHTCEGIFNPMTHTFCPTPSIHYEFDFGFYQGFGFNPKTKQYKMFNAHSESTCELKVLRFGTNHNQWTSIYLPSSIYLRSHGVYMNGVIYWIGKQKENEYVIYALYVETENFEVIGILKVGPYCYKPTLQPFNGTIYAIVCIIKPITQIELWRMQGKDFWIRDFIVPNNFCKFRNTTVCLLKASKDGKILVQIESSLFWLKSGKKIELKEKIKTLIPCNRQFTNYYICLIESLHFGSLPNILVGDD